MTEKQKASQVLQYMEDELDGKAILNVLKPLLKDSDLATIYDKLVSEGSISPEGYCDDTNSDTDPLKPALDYVREQLGEETVAVIRAQVDCSYRYHLAPGDCVTDDDRVIDLLEKYGQDNDLPEGWWENEGDIDDILLKL